MTLKDTFFDALLWLKKPSNALWVTPVLGAMVAVVFAFAAAGANRFFPDNFSINIETDTLDSLLGIIASSMLAVSTFSLSIMVSAFASASNGATPRATELVMGDDNTRVAIASFISAFVYAVIAKTALGIGYYGQPGRFVLFVGTIGVLLYLIYTLINWVKTLSQLGRLNNTLDKIELATEQTLINYRKRPNMGAKGIDKVRYKHAIYAGFSGYLTHINMGKLQTFASKHECEIDIAVRPGALVFNGMAMAYVSKKIDEAQESLCSAFVVEDDRSYAQDPKFGMIVLSEVAQRALSPAVNDPGTAIKVLTVLMRLLLDAKTEEEELEYDKLSIVKLDETDLISQPFSPISRDGASIMEVHIRMQKILHTISMHAKETRMRHAARLQAQIDLDYAKHGLNLDSEIEQVQQIHDKLFNQSIRCA
ncbi:DUF2254 domain-containing protein [Pasteurellaceae bacterium 20609_3]|uniref:DUF2254 domain-containing protein n=1 Tax=Spirabiliibacterium mucosae TaxID=28156 RepID=UPI001AAD2045|nr:DUF2254 family protein [Spirabiliibacterium mucosae]MBE2897983.1 DUF2254 domain-containing protein [Spirabiliibacterium mucosae]